MDAATAHPILATAAPSTLEMMLASSRTVTLGAKKTVLRAGDPADWVHFLIDGAVRVFHKHGSKEILVKLFTAPAMMAEMEVLGHVAMFPSVTTLRRTSLLQIRAAAFRRAVRVDGDFAAAVAYDVSARLCVATVNERAFIFDDISLRLHALFLDYAAVAGVPSGKHTRLDLPLTQQSLAKDLGASRRSVVTALDDMKKNGLLVKADGRYELTNVAELRAACTRRMGLAFSSKVEP